MLFAPTIAKQQAKAADVSTSRVVPRRPSLLEQQPRNDTFELAQLFQCAIGNQAMQRLLARQARGEPESPPIRDLERSVTLETTTAQSPRGRSSDFSKVPLSTPERSGHVQPLSVHSAQPGTMQQKLSIGSVDDPLEQEADAMAERVMRMPDTMPSISMAPEQISPKCAACESEEGEILQRKEAGSAEPSAVPNAEAHIGRPLGPGVPLEPGVRGFFERRFRQSFGNVRVHADRETDVAARRFDALAFTVGRDIAFRAGAYAPHTQSGRRLLAHELTHVLQQRGSGVRIQRAPACPARPRAEAAQSRTPAGILATNVVLTLSTISQLDVMDFAVGSANLPPDTTSDPEWQRALSIMAGDPSIKIQVAAFTDCTGTQPENVLLRRARADTVLSALPREVRRKILFDIPIPTSTFIDTNATPEGRARNRSVRLSFTAAPARGTDPCDTLSRASNMDEYIFLVHCLETRLKLTKPADAPKVLSALRQVYFGSGSWSLKRHSVWDAVMENPAWPPAANPELQLGAGLMAALKASDVVGQTDVSHLLTGIDAMMSPHNVEHLPGLFSATTVPNEEWATWAGDVGSAAAEWVVDTVFTPPAKPLSQKDYFTKFAGDDDLRGDLDAFAMRRGLNPGAGPSSQLMQAIRLTGTLSENLRRYYRLTKSASGVSRMHATRDFIEAYGGVLNGTTVSNRSAFAARLRPSVSQFGHLYMASKLLGRGFFGNAPRPPGVPRPDVLIDPAIDAMTDLFITWLEQHP